GGFSLAIGPIFTPTRWGVVRFKPEEVPSNLVVIANPSIRDVLRRQLDAGRKIGIEIAMVGRLIPDESLVYDFSHDEKGLGIIMPVVRIERVEYLRVRGCSPRLHSGTDGTSETGEGSRSEVRGFGNFEP